MKKKRRLKSAEETALIAVTPVPFSFENLDLQVVRMTSSQSKMELRGGAFPKKTTISVGANIGLSPEENTIKINVTCESETRYDESDADPAIFVKCEFQAVYGHPAGKPPSQESTEKNAEMATMVAMNTIWPYLRHHVFITTSQMGLPPLTLPLFKSRFMPNMPPKVSPSQVPE